ncbi:MULTISPECIES: DegT/DnrJ/EryC1/StrS family aminotransferase [Paenibacillus]|uniref:DegT/DnrJ/EryC1/StrS family aminotransferase n=1 Tax=Paenibacillus TaxID=44249 RepID=UPI00096EA38D|nr:DegT/DnrJ/EryC1/StrS family aminotransferase [Paenibacillus odorifer]MEC0133343.1 aminotransferase class I/II-fold pyridoxal phosphate-dependent enzyme [Paenibacillus odorifer]MEC0221227.1 aminotransferase class I/II-fold pyridoxal phosphate-dependent enzyme [Paenibacillus odorifer]OMD16420.1 pyridoxal phosphate-dependent aminotransferase [Paenibacillus odorifer]OMD26314.1 pyridoxal phosphate-dependent aminotransferase [Paenibacillus odorifer]
MSIRQTSILPRILLSPPHISGREQVYMEEAIHSGWIAPIGPQVDAFEREMAAYTGSKGALALSSGTAAIHLALRLAGVTQGDYVICSTLTFVASANPILYLGATPVFVDSEPETWNMCPLAFQRACQDLNDKGLLPKAAVVVNLYGQSADMEPIVEIADRYGITLIEDAAESLGAFYQGKASGTWGQFGIYSFNGNKIITTSGGGMLVSDDTEALKQARFWSTQARDTAPHYQHSEMGYNYRLSNLLAAIGRGQLELLEERVERRRSIGRRYRERLGSIPGLRFMPEARNCRSTHWLSALTIDEEVAGFSSRQLLSCLEQHNIEARPVWKPLHLQPLFESNYYYPYSEEYSVSDNLFSTGVCLPSGSSLSDEDLERVIYAIETCNQYR